MIVYLENPQEFTKPNQTKYLGLISEFNKFAGYKINAQNKLHFHILTKNMQKLKLKTKYHLESRQRKQNTSIHFLAEHLQDLYANKYKMLMKEIKET